MLLSLTEPQEEFVCSESKYPALVGGLGSGKTMAGIYRLICLMISDPSINGAYYMPTYDLLRLRALSGVEEELEKLGIGYKTNRSEYTVEIQGYGTMILRSYDRPERIVAYEVASLLQTKDIAGSYIRNGSSHYKMAIL